MSEYHDNVLDRQEFNGDARLQRQQRESELPDHSTRPSALARLQDADDQIAKRRAQLSPELSEALTMRLNTWRGDVKHQIRTGAAILAVLIVALVGVGLGVSLTTSYESGTPSRSCGCHVSGRQSTCSCSASK